MSETELRELDIILNQHDNEWDMYKWLVGQEVRKERIGTHKTLVFDFSLISSVSQFARLSAGTRLSQRTEALCCHARILKEQRQRTQDTDAWAILKFSTCKKNSNYSSSLLEQTLLNHNREGKESVEDWWVDKELGPCCS